MLGSTIVFFLSPLGAECSFVAEEQSKTSQHDMYASSFSLMNCSLATAGLLGPLAAGGLQDGFGWKATTIALGALCVSGAIPCVSILKSYYGTRSHMLMIIGFGNWGKKGEERDYFRALERNQRVDSYIKPYNRNNTNFEQKNRDYR